MEIIVRKGDSKVTVEPPEGSTVTIGPDGTISVAKIVEKGRDCADCAARIFCPIYHASQGKAPAGFPGSGIHGIAIPLKDIPDFLKKMFTGKK